MPVVLLCDDEEMNRKIASKILFKEGMHVIEALNGQEALDILKTTKIDVILMDLMMPTMDGYEATKIIKQSEEYSNIPLIVISAISDKQAIIKALELGADDYLTKPFDLTDFRLRTKNAVKIGMFQNMLKDKKILLEAEVNIKTQELQSALQEIQDSEKDIISILAKTAEYRDNETSMHTFRVGEMSALIAKKFNYSKEDVELMRLAAPMHDIGKVGIEDKILLKPGKLSEDEFLIMKEHAFIGYTILSKKKTPLLKLAAEIAYTHHEKYDGSGYPRGLTAEEIPLSGAIVAVVDVFDALLSDRPYKQAFTLEKTIKKIKSASSTHFNPRVVSTFIDSLDEILQIRERLKDV